MAEKANTHSVGEYRKKFELYSQPGDFAIRSAVFQSAVARACSRQGRRKLKRPKFLRASPEEIVTVRNTSRSNNQVSSGLDLKTGAEVFLSTRKADAGTVLLT